MEQRTRIEMTKPERGEPFCVAEFAATIGLINIQDKSMIDKLRYCMANKVLTAVGAPSKVLWGLGKCRCQRMGWGNSEGEERGG